MAGHCRVPIHESIPSLFFDITQYWLYQCKLRIFPMNLPWCRDGSGMLRHIHRVVLFSYVMWSCSNAMFCSFVQLHLFLLQQRAGIKSSQKPASVICHIAQWQALTDILPLSIPMVRYRRSCGSYGILQMARREVESFEWLFGVRCISNV